MEKQILGFMDTEVQKIRKFHEFLGVCLPRGQKVPTVHSILVAPCIMCVCASICPGMRSMCPC